MIIVCEHRPFPIIEGQQADVVIQLATCGHHVSQITCTGKREHGFHEMPV